MLREIQQVRQRANEGHRRWFMDRDMDLILWSNAQGEPIAFELCYDKRQGEKAVRWQHNTALGYFVVDSGEQSPSTAKQAPIFHQGQEADLGRLRADFLHHALELPPELVQFIVAHLTPQAQGKEGIPPSLPNKD